jgi:thiol:disulfide interchange protein DsbG
MKRRALLALLPLVAALAACGKHGAGTSITSVFTAHPAEAVSAWSDTGEALQGRRISLDALKDAKGFTVGNPKATRTVYVMFDPQCPHCGALWHSTHHLWREAKFVWIPVGLINADSALQGAAILASSSPVGAMDRNEELLANHEGGLSVKNEILPADIKSAVQANSLLLASFNAQQVPFIVGVDESSGKPEVIEGPIEPDALVERLHWKRADPQPVAQKVSPKGNEK